MLHRRVDELFKLGKGDDFIEFARDFAFAHAEDGARKKGIFATSQLGMKASADFEEGSDAAVDFRPAHGRARNAREDFQESGLARSVPPDEPEGFTLLDV